MQHLSIQKHKFTGNPATQNDNKGKQILVRHTDHNKRERTFHRILLNCDNLFNFSCKVYFSFLFSFLIIFFPLDVYVCSWKNAHSKTIYQMSFSSKREEQKKKGFIVIILFHYLNEKSFSIKGRSE